jgi:predicted aspartyl protease
MIRGFIDGRAPRIAAVVSVPALGGTPVQVRFLLDTGAATSLISPVDSRAMGLKPRQLVDDPRAASAGGIGGTIRYVAVVALLDFVEDTARLKPYRAPIGIAESSTASEVLPSILGMDFIQHFCLTVSVREARVELEPLF